MAVMPFGAAGGKTPSGVTGGWLTDGVESTSTSCIFSETTGGGIAGLMIDAEGGATGMEATRLFEVMAAVEDMIVAGAV